MDGARLPSSFDKKTKRLAATLPASLEPGDHVLWIHHANMFKNHNWPQRYLLQINKGDRDTQGWIIDTLPATRPSAPVTQPSTTRPARTRAGRPSTAPARR